MSVLQQKKDQWIPWYFVFFFITLFIVDSIMVTLAVKTHTGSVTEHAYEKGVHYNTIIKEADEQTNLGWQGNIQLQNNILIFTLSDKTSKRLTPGKATAFFFRPSTSGMDFEVSLKPDDSVMQEKIDFPAPGLWEVRVYAKVGAREYQQSKRVVVP